MLHEFSYTSGEVVLSQAPSESPDRELFSSSFCDAVVRRICSVVARFPFTWC